MDDIMIIDNGSGYLKAGFLNGENPKLIPTIIGKNKYQNEFLDKPYNNKKYISKRQKKQNKFIFSDNTIIGE